MKKFISIVISVVFILNIFYALGGLSVSAANYTSGDYGYSVSGNTATIEYYNGTSAYVSIPSSIGGYSVTNIGSSSFVHNTSLKGITIPNSVTNIGYGAFNDCTNLTRITISDGLIGIGENAFYCCRNLTSITIPESVTTIGKAAFAGCSSLNSSLNDEGVYYKGNRQQWMKITIGSDNNNLSSAIIYYGTPSETGNCTWYFDRDNRRLTINGTGTMEDYSSEKVLPWKKIQSKIGSVIIDAGVTNIGNYSFSGCTNLRNVTISESVSKIGTYAFYNCSNLRINYKGSYEQWKELTAYCNNTFNTALSSATVYYETPSTTDNYTWYFDRSTKVLTISGSGMMKNYSSTNDVPWGNTRTEIVSVIINNGITSIGSFAFNGCTNLLSITVPYSVTSIGNNAFSGCSSLGSITIPDYVTSIGDNAFSDCTNLSSVYMPSYSVTSIGDNAFSNCSNLTSITIPSQVTSIGTGTFNGCRSLRSISIPNSVSSIGNSAFYGCANLKDANIPNTTSYIGERAFYNCASLESISLPESVTSIYNYTFSGCSNLNYAFYNGYKSNLSIYTGNEPLTKVIKYTKDKGTFNGGEWYFDYSTGVLRITGNSNMEFGYNQTIPWSTYKYDIKSVVIESGITSIADYAFTCCTNLSSVTIPNTVTNIGESAFEGCEALMSLSIPRNVSYIAKDAFYGCKKIQTVNLGSNVFIGDGAFTDCTSLKTVNLSSSVSVIGDNAFSNCTSLESITIPNCDSPLGQYAFSYCANLKTVEIKNGLPDIESSAFYGCSSLKTISIPNSVESIGEEAFNDCKSLTSVTIGTGCKSISSKAFWNCPKLNKLTVKYPNCVFNNSQYTISTTAVICGYKNSTAYTYARSYIRSFEDIETGVRYGWIDGSFIEISSENNPTNPSQSTCDEIEHHTKIVGKKAATYFATGYTGDKVCTVCGKVISKGKVIAKLKLATPKVKITAGKQKLTVKYTKVKDATGFQVKYTYKGKTTTKTYTSKKSITKTIKKLKKGTYKVSVRALIKSKGKTAYSNWTTAKKVKIK